MRPSFLNDCGISLHESAKWLMPFRIQDSAANIAGQLVRCGTAAAPNYEEGRCGESRADFIHKINIALKELVETRGWLKFIIKADLLAKSRVEGMIDECDQLCRILGKSVATAKKNGALRSRDLQ
jgi:four helix bundle protein